MGSLNYIVQCWREKDEDGEEIYTVDQYQPRRNYVWHGEMTKEQALEGLKETIERMKIAQELMQDFIDGKRDDFYFWELENEKEELLKVKKDY